MIARDHDWPDAGALGARHCRLRFGARRVDHADQPQEHEILLDLLVEILMPEVILRERAEGDAERPQGLLGEVVVGVQNGGPARGRERPRLLADEFMRAAPQQDVGRALGEGDPPLRSLGILVNRAHQLAFGRERDFRDALEAGLEGLRFQPGLAGRDDQGAFGGVALD
jgi:hypothetical protein